MQPLVGPLYMYQDELGHQYTVQFLPGGIFNALSLNGSIQPLPNVPYTAMDWSQLYVVVFGDNEQISFNPTPSGDGIPGDHVFNIQMIQAPNPQGYSACQFPITNLNTNQIYLSMAPVGNKGKIVTKPVLDPPIGAPRRVDWPHFKKIIEAEIGTAVENALNRMQKIMEK